MAALEALYLQDPFWLWLALACLFVSLNLASGASLLMWPGMAAAVVALLELAGVRLGLPVEAGAFVVLSLGGLAGVIARRSRAKGAVVADGPGDRPTGKAAGDRQEQTRVLVGRIGRSRGEFVNGVGRVWIEGAEWGADLDGGDGTLPDGASVRVTKVIGGIKLQVQALQTGWPAPT
ncbi:MAG TPA: NfeD family protein [Caulobacteraceae bacterium]|jgi:membrane protein implicated in regulation of membrane protease activity|nr:NfeD family protein [Caulobacteraceae bacterium]